MTSDPGNGKTFREWRADWAATRGGPWGVSHGRVADRVARQYTLAFDEVMSLEDLKFSWFRDADTGMIEARCQGFSSFGLAALDPYDALTGLFETIRSHVAQAVEVHAAERASDDLRESELTALRLGWSMRMRDLMSECGYSTSEPLPALPAALQ